MKTIPSFAAVLGVIIGWVMTPFDFGVTYGELHRMSLLELAFNIGLGIYPVGFITGIAYGIGKARHLEKKEMEFVSCIFVHGIKVVFLLPACVCVMFTFIGIGPLLIESPVSYFALIIFEKIIYVIVFAYGLWFFFQVLLKRPLNFGW